MVKTFKDISELSQYAARSFIQIANKSIEERGRFLTALSGGNTPMRLYELLGNQFQNEVDWSRVHFFGVMKDVYLWMMQIAIMDKPKKFYSTK